MSKKNNASSSNANDVTQLRDVTPSDRGGGHAED